MSDATGDIRCHHLERNFRKKGMIHLHHVGACHRLDHEHLLYLCKRCAREVRKSVLTRAAEDGLPR